MEPTFDLPDLKPRECTIILEVGGEEITCHLQKFSLLVQIKIREEFGSMEAWKEAIDPESKINKDSGQLEQIKALCRTLHILIREKDLFPTWESLAEAIGHGPNEIMNVNRALLTTIGMSNPIQNSGLKKKVMRGGSRKRSRAGTR